MLKPRLLTNIEHRLTAIADPVKPWPSKTSWARVCSKCVPMAVIEFLDVGLAPLFDWQPWPLVFKHCDRCRRGHFRFYMEFYPVSRKVLEEKRWKKLA